MLADVLQNIFLKISQNSQEKFAPESFLKGGSSTDVSPVNFVKLQHLRRRASV